MGTIPQTAAENDKIHSMNDGGECQRNEAI